MVPCYVIYLDDGFPNEQSLLAIGLKPIGFRGVDARKDEHLEYTEHISGVCDYTCPKSLIGCGLSHILLMEKLYNENVQLALILEDDAYPIQNIDINKIISEVPPDWEIIKLHCDVYSVDGSQKPGLFSGSAAAYIINLKGIIQVKNMKVKTHFDMQLYNSDIKMYKTPVNLFMTDESYSKIRDDGSHWMSRYMPETTGGQKTKDHIFMYRLLKIPGTSIELKLGHILNIVFFRFVLILIFVIVIIKIVY